MKLLTFVLAFVAILLLSTGCTTSVHSPTQIASNFINRESVTPSTPQTYPAKNPSHVAFYTQKERPLSPYRVIGVAKVSKYNLIGMQRKDETVHKMMKKLAASIGGDGLIDVDHTNETYKANVIQFQKIMI